MTTDQNIPKSESEYKPTAVECLRAEAARRPISFAEFITIINGASFQTVERKTLGALFTQCAVLLHRGVNTDDAIEYPHDLGLPGSGPVAYANALEGLDQRVLAELWDRYTRACDALAAHRRAQS
jgi:hypothetical protein